MSKFSKNSDHRLNGFCVYCGRYSQTRDHVPSKILLDEPYPVNLLVVPACSACNHDFSLDEEYFACLIECARNGTIDLEELERKKIRKILEQKPKLLKRIANEMEFNDGGIIFRYQEKRVKKIILKLARGHAAYENSELQLSEPECIRMKPIHTMSDRELTQFNSHVNYLLPEVGSRAFQRIFTQNEKIVRGWNTVQENKYTYSICFGQFGFSVKFVIWNYLTCEVIWR